MNEGVHFVHVGIEFESKTRPVEVVQCRANLRERRKSRLVQEVDFAFFDESVTKATHAAEDVTDGDERN